MTKKKASIRASVLMLENGTGATIQLVDKTENELNIDDFRLCPVKVGGDGQKWFFQLQEATHNETV